MEQSKIWFRGRIVERCNATISVLSPTAQFGINVFEGIRCYWDDESNQLYGFRLQNHYKRLLNSCKLVGIESPYSIDELTEHMKLTLKANDYREDVAVRQTLFVDGEGSWFSCSPVEMFIAPIAKPRSNTEAMRVVNACVSTWERIGDSSVPPRAKVGANYLNSRYAQLEARANGYDIPVILNSRKNVSEGPGSCLFLVKEETLIAPPISSSILDSITRASLIKIASDNGIAATIREIERTELYLADELFFCGSAIEIAAIGSIDKRIVGDGQAGVITKLLLEKYLEIASGKNRNYLDWLTPIY